MSYSPRKAQAAQRDTPPRCEDRPPTPTSTAIHAGLAVCNLCKRFIVAGRELVALDDVTLSVDEGEFVTIIGPSGGGKTTLLRCIGGFERPTSGSVLVDGRAPQGPGADRMIVFQSFDQLFPWLTAIENVACALRLTRTVPGVLASRRVARSYLQLVGLSGCEDLFPHQLSGGMKQRVAIARALSVRPRVLLMDEPFGSLDALTRAALQEELTRIWQETKVTIMFVTHNIEEAVVLGDRIVVLTAQPGRIAAALRNPLPRPRSPEDAVFRDMCDTIHGFLGLQRRLKTASQPALQRVTIKEVDVPRLMTR